VYDVVIVGAGPAGIAAAFRCAKSGLDTLLLEKQKFPRKKVCDGIMGPIARGLIKQELGEIPDAILSDPPYVEVVEIVVHGSGIFQFEEHIPLLWREDLDYWMVQQAQTSGFELREDRQFIGMAETQDGYRLRISGGEIEEAIEARFVIGADGAVSRVRQAIFPDLHFGLISQGIDCWHGEIDLSPGIYRAFYDPQVGGLLGFSLHVKDGVIVISYAADRGNLAPIICWTRELLESHYRLKIKGEPVWKGRCMSPDMAGEIASARFIPAKRNVLLVGDAGGFMMPVGEGIGPGFKSGLMAADAVVAALHEEGNAQRHFQKSLQSMITALGKAHMVEKDAFNAAEKGGDALLQHLKESRSEDFHLNY
jgi:flavin-dependent dehydrogenase